MSVVTQALPRGAGKLDPNDPFRYGWRYVTEKNAEGKLITRQVPLTEEDVLHPQEDDFIMLNPLHEDNVVTVRNAVALRLEDRPGYVWLCDCRVDWGVEGVEPLGPDITVLRDVFGWGRTQEGTFHVAVWNAKPVLAIEITSPSTRNGDLGAKVTEYYQARIPLYVIVDLIEDEDAGEVLRLLCYRAGPEGYILEALEDPTRVWLEPIGLWLVVEGPHVACFDEHGRRLGDILETARQATEAERQRVEAEQRVTEAERQRVEAEQRVTEAERQRVEADQRAAQAERQRVEADQRAAQAERQRVEADQRASDVEARMREMEAELRRLRGE